MNTKDLMLSCCGTDENGRPKAIIKFFNEIWHLNDEIETVREIEFDTPIIQIFEHAGYYQVDVCYPNGRDIDLRVNWSFLEDFCVPENSLNDETKDIPSITVSILPYDYLDEYYILAVNPIFWTLQPEKPGEDCTVIRLIFDEDNFMFYRLTDDEEEQ